jgi:hypothetical protein
MSSYDGRNTAQKQNEMRRAMKQKQRHTSGKGKVKVEKVEEVKIPRHVRGVFCEKTLDDIRAFFTAHPSRVITYQFFKNALRNGVTVQVCDEDHPLYNTVVTVTENGFDFDGSNIEVYSLTVNLAQGFGVQFKKVGGRDGRPERVIVS